MTSMPSFDTSTIDTDIRSTNQSSAAYPSAYQFWKLMCKLTKLNNEEVKQKRSFALKASDTQP
ncbi:hypothetical protein [Hydrogenovibrio sp. JE_KL2]|uniref:hypothetical protein n=1 Tax=Hydrogenovibrio sp. JE_KL2 TaxID=2651188 RepID=UPI00128DFF4B|nr:hypothetical protein [Hydrogenovibrio sp. JE_KL2]MBN2606450.1 hypothetical protein [Thiotrichales bacterium]MPQ76807.1 hypothetical protein [Hydrogenovibrio sp. JE_KL2]